MNLIDLQSTSSSGVVSGSGSGRKFDVRLVTKDVRFSIPETTLQVLGGSTVDEFNEIVKSLLRESPNLQSSDNLLFDFLIEDHLLRLTLDEHLEEVAAAKGQDVTTEREVVVEYFVRQSAPKPQDSLQHEDWVSSVHTISANDGKGYILSGSYDGSVNIWSVEDGQHVVRIPAHNNHPVKAVRWMTMANKNNDDDELIFLSASHDETIKIWKWKRKETSQTKVSCPFVGVGHVRSVDCVSANQDLIASGSFDRLLKIWSFSTDGSQNEDQEDEDEKSAKRRKKEETIDIDDEKKKKMAIKTPLLTLSGHSEAITGLTWLSDDASSTSTAPELVTCSMDNTMRVWDIEVSQCKTTIASSKAFLGVSYQPSSSLILSASTDRHVRLWDLRTGKVATTFTSHIGWVSSVSWAPSNINNLFVSGSYDHQVKYWDVRLPSASLYDLMGHKDKVLAVDWTHPDFIVSGSSDHQVKVFRQQNKNKL